MYEVERSLLKTLTACVLLFGWHGPTAAQNQEARVLELGKPVERELAGEQAHYYLIELASNDILHVIVEQRGVDVVVTVCAPDGKKLKEVDSPNGTEGPEPVLLIAEAAGAYRLEVRALEKGTAGKYGVTLTEKRAATSEDRTQIAKQALVEQAQELSYQAISLYRQGRYKDAVEFAERALAIMETASGPEHPFLATTLDNLAGLYQVQGDYTRAALLSRRALAIYEKILGPKHPAVATSLNSLALLYDATGDYTRALSFHQRASEVSEKNIALILDSGSQQQKQLYLNTLSRETNYGVSLHAQGMPQNAGAARLAMTTILRRKGRVLDAFTGQLDALRRRAAPGDKKLLDDLAAVQSQLANLQLGSSELAPDARRAEVARLISEQERLEDAISRRSAEFRAVRQPITLERVQAAVPNNAALVELFVYEPFNAKARGNEQRYGAARYVAYVVRRSEAVPQFVDLGEAVPMDAAAAQFRNALKSPKSSKRQVERLARDLDARLMQPIRKLLGNIRRVLLAPDGALNLIPFESLVDENGHYLIKSYSFNYLTSGRDLLRLQVTGASETGASIVANPRFDLTRPVVNCRTGQHGLDLMPGAHDTKVEYRGTDFTKLCYSSLAGTAQEATALVPLLRDAKMWTQQDATEAALKSLHRPRICTSRHTASSFLTSHKSRWLVMTNQGEPSTHWASRRRVGRKEKTLCCVQA